MPQLSLHTPLGEVTVTEEDGALVALDWGRGRDQEPTPLLVEARAQLHDVFDGARDGFDLPLAPRGTAFQRRVWDALRAIPRGEVRTYGDLARALGTAARAVGGAVGANPLPVLIPCHRVVAGGGALGGYSGGEGAETKALLLRLEGWRPPPRARAGPARRPPPRRALTPDAAAPAPAPLRDTAPP